MRDVLHADEALEVALVVDEAGGKAGLELSVVEGGGGRLEVDDIVVFLDDSSQHVEEVKPGVVRVELGRVERLMGSARLSVRVGEFFEGWEFGGDGD